MHNTFETLFVCNVIWALVIYRLCFMHQRIYITDWIEFSSNILCQSYSILLFNFYFKKLLNSNVYIYINIKQLCFCDSFSAEQKQNTLFESSFLWSKAMSDVMYIYIYQKAFFYSSSEFDSKVIFLYVCTYIYKYIFRSNQITQQLL